MKTQFTKKTAKFGCYSRTQVTNANLNDEFTIEDVLNADVKLRDKAWFIRNNCEFTNEEYRHFAIGCALVVLPIYETKYPDNKAPRKAIEAAKAYLAGTIELEELQIARKAAYAAAAADDAAYAAAAAAAYAAAAAADAAAYAADAAADAAAYAADAAAAYAADYRVLLLEFFKEFTSQK